MTGSYGVTEGVLKEVQHVTVGEEAPDVKQGLGRKWREDEGSMLPGANWSEGCWECAENCGQEEKGTTEDEMAGWHH